MEWNDHWCVSWRPYDRDGQGLEEEEEDMQLKT